MAIFWVVGNHLLTVPFSKNGNMIFCFRFILLKVINLYVSRHINMNMTVTVNEHDSFFVFPFCDFGTCVPLPKAETRTHFCLDDKKKVEKYSEISIDSTAKVC